MRPWGAERGDVEKNTNRDDDPEDGVEETESEKVPPIRLHGGTTPLTEEETDDIALEFACESLGVPIAYTINGAISGMITVAIRHTEDDGQSSPGSFGILEVYALTMIFLGGMIFREKCVRSAHPRTADLIDFYKEVWAKLTGFALGSIATR
mmetsp:Transcript_21511/g.63003  ORF Transcript_21511/g.63003 Transcript_21511/m.63003 type:complete len:152 (+) Transcript_21511:468-923(+)